MKNTILLILISCSMGIAQDINVEVHGHRGCRGVLPENSIDGFRHALEMGVNVLEMDLVVNAENQLVISHEPWMNPEICTLAGKRLPQKSRLSILEMTHSQMQQFDCGSVGNPNFPDQERRPAVKPLFREVVEMVQEEYPDLRNSIVYNLEIKYLRKWEGKYVPSRSAFLDLFLQTIGELGIGNQVILQCFDRKVLQMARDREVEFPLSYLVQNIWGSRYNLKKLGFLPEYYSPHFKLLTSKTMRRMKEKGIKVVPWTVNKEGDIRKMLDLRVDGIISDYPNRIKEAIQE